MDFDDKDFVRLTHNYELVVDEVAGAYISWGGMAHLQGTQTKCY